MSSNPFDIAEQLQFLGSELMSEATQSTFMTSTSQKVRRKVKKPRKLINDFGATLRQKQNDHATSTPTNKVVDFPQILHEKPEFGEIPPKRVKVTTKKDPFPKPHTSKAVVGMQKKT